MLDQLVESRSTSKENTRRSGFFLTIFVIMFAVLISAWMYSLFAKDFGMGGSDIELSTLVAPVPVPENEPPPPPEPEQQQPAKQIQQDTKQNVDVRQQIIANINESPTKVEQVSVQKSNVAERRMGVVTKLGNIDSNATGSPSGPTRSTGSSGGGTRTIGPTQVAKPDPPDIDEPPPAPPKPTPTPAPTPKPAPKTISGGVVNGKAISLPQPVVPAAAKAIRANGTVSVQILIDENGNVVSANATGGHPLLRAPAEQAARRAKFKPTQLSGQPVKVSGVITYNFQ